MTQSFFVYRGQSYEIKVKSEKLKVKNLLPPIKNY